MQQPNYRLALGCCTYSDHVGLKRLLDSTHHALDRLIVVHTRYLHFPLQDPHSLSRTQEVCSQYSNVQLIAPARPITQIAARSKYMRAAQAFDFLIVLDSDEYIAADADWDLFRENLWKATLYCPGSRVFDLYTGGAIGQSGARPRIFYKPGTIYYYSHHYWFVIKETGRLLKGASDSAHLIKGITIVHDKTLRSKEMTEAGPLYESWQLINEHA